jgi:Cdc6-like AAA superfamily ATPase
MDDSRRYGLILEIEEAFTPGAAIDSKDLFAGRKLQREMLMSTIFRKGEHAILFGEAGVGKTSLANIVYDVLVVMGKFSWQRAKVNCGEGMSFDDIWRSAFKQLFFEQDGESVTLDQILPNNPNSEQIRETFQSLNDRSIVIIDEFDKVKDRKVQSRMAHTIKTLSDNAISTTLILVGVGDSIEQLIEGHASVERPLIQVPMKRMAKFELVDILDKGLPRCEGLEIVPEARDRIADYSQGLPYYTHLLARESALHAVSNDRTKLTMDDLNAAIRIAVNSKLETNLTAYNKAVTAPRGTNFPSVLLACALAKKTEQQWFYARDVIAPLSYISKKSVLVPAFAKHLKAFCEESRGRILERRGPPRKVQYRFRKPLMETYVVLRGLADGLIIDLQLSHPSESSTEPEQLSLLSSASAPAIEI